MADLILRPITEEGRVTIPKEIREDYGLKGYVEIVPTRDGILIRSH